MKIKERERGGMERVKGRVRGREKRRGWGRGRHRGRKYKTGKETLVRNLIEEALKKTKYREKEGKKEGQSKRKTKQRHRRRAGRGEKGGGQESKSVLYAVIGDPEIENPTSIKVQNTTKKGRCFDPYRRLPQSTWRLAYKGFT